jgi:hypothetical protein
MKTSPAALRAMLAVFLMAALGLSATLQARTRLSNWSAEYPLLVGNELTGDRPWRGRVFNLTITDRATSPAALSRFAAGEPITLAGTPIAEFVFAGSPPYRDARRDVPALSWTDKSGRPTSEGVMVPGSTWLQSEVAAADLVDDLQATNAFSIRLQCAAENGDQRGPARIVSNSVSPMLRNFTVGQQGPDLVFRLRTPRTGLNGSSPETIVPGVFASTTGRQDIVTSYDGTNVLIGVAGRRRLVSMPLGPEGVLAPLIAQFRSEPDIAADLKVARAAYVTAFFLPPAVLIGALTGDRRTRVPLYVTYPLVAAVLLEATLVAVSGRVVYWSEVASTAAAGAVILASTGWVLPVSDSRSRRDESRSTAKADRS